MPLKFFSTTLLVAGLATAAAADDAVARLTVSGEGSVSVAPDQVTLRVGVQQQRETAADAVADMSEAMSAMLRNLGGAGIPEEDIQTVDVGLSPVYSRDSDGGARKLEAFSAGTTLVVVLRDTAMAGDVLDLVVSAGGNRLQGITFGLQDPAIAADAARSDAVADAMRRATLLATAAGVTLGPIHAITETGAAMPRPQMMDGRMAVADAAMPIAPGALTVRAQVELVYDIVQ